MALDQVTLRDDLVSDMEVNIEGFSDLSDDIKEALRDGLASALSAWLYRALTQQAEVSFGVGEITGLDSMGDTHELLTASGGKVS